MHTFFGIIAGILAVGAYIPYIRSILHGKTKPNRTSFIIWAVVDLVLISSYISSGARTTIWVALVYCAFQIAVLFLSIKNGIGGLGKLDIICLLGALAGVILWISTKNSQTALYLSIFCEILGYLPTIRKAYFHPETESKLAWNIGLSASAFNLLAINALALDIMIYPIYNFIFVAIVAGLLITRQPSQKPAYSANFPR